jgi:FkbM family methyltransferase
MLNESLSVNELETHARGILTTQDTWEDGEHRFSGLHCDVQHRRERVPPYARSAAFNFTHNVFIKKEEVLKENSYTKEEMIVFDVGANNADQTRPFLEKGADVWAFEPNPIMIHDMNVRLGTNPRFHLTECAVSDKEGTCPFYLSGPNNLKNPLDHHIGFPNYGSSSLLNFEENLDKTWPGRLDFVPFGKIEVKVIRLDKFMKENNIPHIDYLHIDTQGNDLSVMRGLGEYLPKVKRGVLEAPTSKTVSLYKESHTMIDAIKFLKENNFKIDDIESNTPEENEVNIYFSQKN